MYTASDEYKKDEIKIISLLKNGENILVTDKNKEKYINLMVRHLTEGRFGVQARAVRKGIEM
jgi:hypothetical protein